MLISRRIGRLLGVGGLLSLSLSGCSQLVSVQAVQQPPHWSNSWRSASGTVKLQGTVGSLAPLLKGQVYELQDATGKIWVLSPNRQLKTGQRILIQGRVRREAIEVAGQSLTEVYIEEQQQLTPSPE